MIYNPTKDFKKVSYQRWGRIIMVIALSFLLSCEANNKVDAQNIYQAKNKPLKAENIKVTFIELGSVNCVPCRMMQKVMHQIEEKYGDQVKIIFYDVWTAEGKPYAKKYGIRAIPTQVFLDKNGNEYFRHVGFYPFDAVEEILKKQGVQ